MPATICSNCQHFEIKTWREVQSGDVARTFPDTSFALRFLRRFLHDSFAMASLRRVAARHLGGSSISSYSDQDVLRQLAPALVAGRLHFVPLDRPRLHSYARGNGSGGVTPETPDEVLPDDYGPVPPIAPPEGPVPPTYWITFQVVDDDTEEPIAGVDLQLRLPGGAMGTYTTDAEGVVHLQGLEPGTADIQQVHDDEALEVVALD